jgi:hypothetical protein
MQHPMSHFSRNPVERDGQLQISSRCNYCGTRVIGRPSRSFEEQEAEHIRKCLAPFVRARQAAQESK